MKQGHSRGSAPEVRAAKTYKFREVSTLDGPI